MNATATPHTQPPPNVVLIVCDDLGWGDLACHGNPHVRTPALDALHHSAARLTRYCSGPLCTPARASLMTGRYHLRTGAFDTYLGRSMIRPDERTLAHVLGHAGYATGLFGKWHLGDNAPSRPHDMGFDEALYHLGGGLRQPGNIGRDSYFSPDLMHNGRLVRSRGYCTDVFTDAAIGFIEQHRRRPFFCFLSTNAPHTPLEAPEHLIEPYRELGLPEPFARVYAMVQNIDANVGRLFAKLDEWSLTANTLVVFTSDHGPCAGANHGDMRRFNANLRDGKGTLYEGGIRVPCLWRWPDRIAPGREVHQVTSPIDVLPTLAAAAGAELPGDRVIDGENLLPVLSGQPAGEPLERRSVFMQWHRGDEAQAFRNAGCIQQRFKWYRPHLDADELYDLQADPFEQRNLAAELPDQVAAMREVYARWFDDVAHTRPDNFAPTPILLDAGDDEPTVLTWQDWRTYEPREVWSVDNPGWWLVRVPHDSAFDVQVETDGAWPGHTLHVRCGERVAMSCPTHDELRGYLFEAVALPAGVHDFEAFLTDGAGRRIGVSQVQLHPRRSVSA